jgi:hypothetical protein
MVYSGAWGKLFHEKKTEVENLLTLSLLGSYAGAGIQYLIPVSLVWLARRRLTRLHQLDTSIKLGRQMEQQGIINYIDTKAKCHHLKKLTLLRDFAAEFIDWRYSQSGWYFRPSFVNCFPSPLLSGSTLPPPTPFPV